MRLSVPATARRSARALAVALLAASVVLVGLPAAHADDRDDLEQQQEQNEAEREELAAQLEGTNSELADVYLQLDDIERRLPIAETELATANDELAAAQREAEAVQNRLDVAEAQRADLEDQIGDAETEISDTETAMGEVARSAYRGGQQASTLSVVLEATSAEDFVDQYSVMSSALRTQNQALTDMESLMAVNRNRQARLDAVQERINELKVEADAAVVRAEEARQRAADLLAEIEQLQRQQQERKSELQDLRTQYQDQIAEIEDDNDRIADEIAEIDRREREAERRRQAEARRQAQQQAQSSRGDDRDSGSSGNSGSSGSSGSSGGSSSLIPPISGGLRVTSPYGMRWYPITGGYYMHQGVDLSSPCGQAQRSSAAGTVSAVRPAPNGTHGNQVMINHGTIGGNTYVTVYNHLSRFAVSSGESVSQGETIGYTGATGMVTGCHVHFEVWRNGSTIDPMGLSGF
ncbi:MAG TPA: peptidoglycan DD-metalloendopeptidase family protein [Candidatus Ruania gallistercoris]|uniref:Peptidoglycan DD-metalloendopeptidase family protein n=1 Tax=Candidatus Ruania gallistercoris TaxID=2838746 RepID=A0A9D2J5C0_9MICO|nr:peptidoglycan DD-metalloendopeptidase family protein [Candidatus Ruania gallistercoris]